jgi:hypothetical protein
MACNIKNELHQRHLTCQSYDLNTLSHYARKPITTLKNISKQFIVVFLCLSAFTSCNNQKNYKYIEVIEEEGVFGGTAIKEERPKMIKASTDSTAYLEAYKNFCISLKVNRDMKQSLGKVYSTPIKFKLYNEKGVEITNTVPLSDKVSLEKRIEGEIFSMKNTIQDAADKNKEEEIESFKKAILVDTAKIKDLETHFRIKKDEFSNGNKKWYKPKNAPIYTNANGIYCYFQIENGMPGNLRLRLQYYADDWLFFKKVQFSIDDKAYNYIPLETETDSGDGGYIWEWFDQSVDESDKELLHALANAKSAKMKLIGRQYYDIRTISHEQISSFKRTLDLYEAMGGK